MASSGRRRGRLGDARRPGKRDRPPRRQRHRSGELREASDAIPRTVWHREKRGRETDMWGPRVRKFFYLNFNFRIVTRAFSEFSPWDLLVTYLAT